MAKINELQQMQELEMESLTKERERHNELRQSLRKEKTSLQETTSQMVNTSVTLANLEKRIDENKKYLHQLREGGVSLNVAFVD